MELKEFIRQSLFEITEGIREANEAYAAVPGRTGEKAFHLWPSGPTEQEVEKGIQFDVAVTIKEEIGGKGHASVGIKVLGAGADMEGQYAKENVSRIRFTVAIHHYIG